jgi:hypothetical protein
VINCGRRTCLLGSAGITRLKKKVVAPADSESLRLTQVFDAEQLKARMTVVELAQVVSDESLSPETRLEAAKAAWRRSFTPRSAPSLTTMRPAMPEQRIASMNRDLRALASRRPRERAWRTAQGRAGIAGSRDCALLELSFLRAGGVAPVTHMRPAAQIWLRSDCPSNVAAGLLGFDTEKSAREGVIGVQESLAHP